MWWRKASGICPFHLFLPQLMQLSICILMLLLTLSRMKKGRSIISLTAGAQKSWLFKAWGARPFFFFSAQAYPYLVESFLFFLKPYPIVTRNAFWVTEKSKDPISSCKLAAKQSVKSWIRDFYQRQNRATCLSLFTYQSILSMHPTTDDLQDWECCGKNPRQVPAKQHEMRK